MRSRTIGLIVIFVLGLLAAPLLAETQQAGKVYRKKSASVAVWLSERERG